MENISETSNINSVACGKVINIKESQSFNESNLMTLPFISLKRKRVDQINRVWVRNGQEIGLKVVGGEFKCPTIYELDVLMALFKIQAKNMNNKLEILTSNAEVKNGEVLTSKYKIVNMPKVIKFTYRGLAKEMGLSGFGKSTKQRLEASIKCLNECTIYSTMAIRDHEQDEYIIDFNGVESSRILKNYKSYSITKWKKAKKKLLDPAKVEEYQSVEIDDFFFKNLCSNFLKLYDYNTYKTLKSSVAKKIQLILTQWSHGYEKYIKFQTLYDYIGLDTNTKNELYYANKQLKIALEELKQVKFIEDYFYISEGVNLVFNNNLNAKNRNLDKYNNENDIVGRLREIGIDYDDIVKYCRADTIDYISALLRYVDYRLEKGYIDDVKLFTLKGLPYRRYDVEKYMADI